MADDEFTANSDESEWWNEESFFFVPDSFIEDECKRLEESNLTTDELIKKLAECTFKELKSFARLEEFANAFGQIERAIDAIKQSCEDREASFKKQTEVAELIFKMKDKRAELMAELGTYTGVKAYKKDKAASAANARHSKPNGARAKAEAIRKVWASGKYSSRDICAEQECAGLDMSFATARKALRNTPDPT